MKSRRGAPSIIGGPDFQNFLNRVYCTFVFFSCPVFFPCFGREKKGTGAAFFPKTTLILILYENDQEGLRPTGKGKKIHLEYPCFYHLLKRNSCSNWIGTIQIYVNVVFQLFEHFYVRMICLVSAGYRGAHTSPTLPYGNLKFIFYS